MSIFPARVLARLLDRVFDRVLGLLLGRSALRRDPAVDDRATLGLLLARCADELFSGLLLVLLPTLRARLGLSIAQVGWCLQALTSVAAVVEPVAGVAIDHLRRRPLLVVGAAGWGVALLLAAGAGGFALLLAAFALVGLTSGLLAQTADVVLVETHPADVERISSRATWLDTIGALAAPGAVAVAAWAGADGRVLLLGAGVAGLGYALLLATISLPPPSRARSAGTPVAEALAGVREVVADRRARRWLVGLLLLALLDPIELFEPVWLASSVGMSQGLVAVHAVLGTAAALVATVALDRWLAHHDATPVLWASAIATLVAVPAWLLVPGVAAKLVLVVLRDVVAAPLWPILRARALAALPGRGGTASAISTLTGLLPLPALIGWAAARVGLTRMLLVVSIVALAGLVALLCAPDPARPDQARPEVTAPGEDR